jgi:hypothetical protein
MTIFPYLPLPLRERMEGEGFFFLYIFCFYTLIHAGSMHNVKNEIPDQVRNDNLSLFASPLEGEDGR